MTRWPAYILAHGTERKKEKIRKNKKTSSSEETVREDSPGGRSETAGEKFVTQVEWKREGVMDKQSGNGIDARILHQI